MPIVRNKKTGVTSSVPAHYLGHPVLGANIELVTGEFVAAPAQKKGKPTKEQIVPEVAPDVAQPEITSKEIEDGN
ncbi:hypothetical protein UFOVP536_16 [uncultured Caudovirales phage]|uniref:Uncharacterized protein n=1 Tax=uncultured Caudovirales phage TaxID=2100421 RepID=A0A6J5MUP5_9CAUD|nr:hypothetical protein UFOVP536_16 [uncultured Caudovirales phage]